MAVANFPELGSDAIVLSEEVLEARRQGLPIVALESTIISHGLPRPRNLEVATELEGIVRAGGACPATIAVLDGRAHVGLTPEEVERVAFDPAMRKLGFRDLSLALATGSSGATTVSAVTYLSSLAGIRVFATGGLGGVHRGWMESWDESADLAMMSRTRITVVAAGVKSILDIAATLQRLETLNVSVVGYRTATFPGFYLHSSGFPLEWTLDSPEQVAAAMRWQDQLGGPDAALLVANPVPLDDQLDPELHDRVLESALAAADEAHVTGQPLTPFLLDYMATRTGGASVTANLAAVRGNVALGTQIACAYEKAGAGASAQPASAQPGSVQ